MRLRFWHRHEWKQRARSEWFSAEGERPAFTALIQWQECSGCPARKNYRWWPEFAVPPENNAAIQALFGGAGACHCLPMPTLKRDAPSELGLLNLSLRGEPLDPHLPEPPDWRTRA